MFEYIRFEVAKCEGSERGKFLLGMVMVEEEGGGQLPAEVILVELLNNSYISWRRTDERVHRLERSIRG